MTEMQVYHEIVEGISYVALVVGRKCHNGSIEPWDTDEITVREMLCKLPFICYEEVGLYAGFKVFGVSIGSKIFSKQYHVYDATENLEETIADLRELNQDPNINLEISEGLSEVVRKLLPLEFK